MPGRAGLIFYRTRQAAVDGDGSSDTVTAAAGISAPSPSRRRAGRGRRAGDADIELEVGAAGRRMVAGDSLTQPRYRGKNGALCSGRVKCPSALARPRAGYRIGGRGMVNGLTTREGAPVARNLAALHGLHVPHDYGFRQRSSSVGLI